MNLTDKQISEIGELLDCGMTCFYHIPTGEIESHPDPNDGYFDPEPWQDLIDKIESDWGNYERFVKMDSNESYQVMERFANSLTDTKFRDKVIESISRRRPFQNFKRLIHHSEYLQMWFDFKNQSYIEYVRAQIELKK